MKTSLLALVLALTSLELWAQSPPGFPTTSIPRSRPPRFGVTNGPVTQPRYTPPATGLPGAPGAPGAAASATAASAASAAALLNAQPEETIPAGTINFQGVDVNQVLDVYAQLVGRTLLRASLPDAKIVLKTQTPLTKTEAIQALQAVLALNNISVINIGDKFVKVLQSDQANTAAAELDRSGATNLPNLGSYVTHITQLKYVKPTVMMPLIQPFSKLPNSVYPIDDNGILVIRDYAENVKRMLEMIAQIDVSVPAEYISEVIPIRYAMVSEIASALNSLGGSGGGATVSIGGSTSGGQISGLAGNRSSSMGGGMGGVMGGMNSGMGGYQSGGMGGSTSAFGGRGGTAVNNPNGTPTGGSTFAQRLNNIVNRASGATGGGGGGQDQIQLFGQTKIVPNESSSSLLVFATRQDMAMIKEIIAKLDVPLAQVLIEAIIMDVNLGHTFDFGVSAAQSKKTLIGTDNPMHQTVGAGGMNNAQPNAQPFLNLLNSAATNAFSPNSLPSGSSYFANIGNTWDIAVQAAQADSHANIIQRPRIQTSQAQPAQFFVGSTVPYITGNYSYYGGGPQNSYSQLSVGVELDVTPFINPDGVVSMQIQQQIDEIDNANYNGTDQPSTIKRTLNTTITVRDRDTVILGGFVKTKKSNSKSGVPFLMDIPVLGNLFTKRNDEKDRTELVVLMRPTVLKTPEIAARNTVKETQRLPGISDAAAENARDERKLIDAQRKREKADFKKTGQYDGFFNPEPDASDTNRAPASAPAGKAAPAAGQPLSDKEAQEKARAALLEKMSELDSGTNAPAPSQ